MKHGILFASLAALLVSCSSSAPPKSNVTSPVVPPQGLTLSQVQGQPVLQWQDVPDETAFEVMYSPEGQHFRRDALLPANTLKYGTGQQWGYYAVRSLRDGVTSEPGSVVFSPDPNPMLFPTMILLQQGEASMPGCQGIWSGQDSHIVQVTGSGQAKGLQAGNTRVFCSTGRAVDVQVFPALTFQNQQLSSGNQHNLTVLQGKLRVWGWNGYGQASPAEVLPQVREGVAGWNHSVAVLQNGQVYAWGRNTFGQLGLGNTEDRDEPGQVLPLIHIMTAGAGMEHTLAVQDDGTVWAWGHNNVGQLGDGTTTDRLTPVQVKGLTGIVQVVAGVGHSLALKKDGSVWAWGWNLDGQLGDGSTTNHSTPFQVPGLSGIVRLAAGHYHSVALRADGVVFAWGDNHNGRLGVGDQQRRLSPVQLTGLGMVIDIAAGASHSLALMATGQVYSWGKNNSGQLGLGHQLDQALPVQVPGLEEVVALSAGRAHSVIKNRQDAYWAWGSNFGGQLGDGTFEDQFSPVRVVVWRPAMP